MAYENLRKQYIEFRRDMKSIPTHTESYRKLKLQLKEFLNEVRDKHGQETVDKLTNYNSRVV